MEPRLKGSALRIWPLLFSSDCTRPDAEMLLVMACCPTTASAAGATPLSNAEADEVWMPAKPAMECMTEVSLSPHKLFNVSKPAERKLFFPLLLNRPPMLSRTSLPAASLASCRMFVAPCSPDVAFATMLLSTEGTTPEIAFDIPLSLSPRDIAALLTISLLKSRLTESRRFKDIQIKFKLENVC